MKHLIIGNINAHKLRIIECGLQRCDSIKMFFNVFSFWDSVGGTIETNTILSIKEGGFSRAADLDVSHHEGSGDVKSYVLSLRL